MQLTLCHNSCISGRLSGIVGKDPNETKCWTKQQTRLSSFSQFVGSSSHSQACFLHSGVFKGLIRPKLKNLSSFNLMFIQNCVTFFLLWKIKEDVWQNVQTVFNTMKANGEWHYQAPKMTKPIKGCYIQILLEPNNKERSRPKFRQVFICWKCSPHTTPISFPL